MVIQKNPFLKYLIKDQKPDIVHSSAYAKMQSGASMGAASTESYEVRVNVNQNRTRVKGYADSKLVTEARMNAPKAKTYVKPEPETTNARDRSGVAGDRSSATRDQSGSATDSRVQGNRHPSGAAEQKPGARGVRTAPGSGPRTVNPISVGGSSSGRAMMPAKRAGISFKR